MKTKWKDTPLLHKVAAVCTIVLSILVMVLGVLQIFQIWDSAIRFSMPLMGILMLCQAYLQWNNSRKVAWLSIAAAAFIFVCAIGVFFVQ